jgi:hypothetical protein
VHGSAEAYVAVKAARFRTAFVQLRGVQGAYTRLKWVPGENIELPTNGLQNHCSMSQGG